jgi:hypothetical protein
MIMRGVIIVLCFFLNSVASAQGYNVHGAIVDKTDSSGIPAVNVIIWQGSDTLGRKISSTSPEGAFSFSNVQPGTYTLKTLHLGYQTFVKSFTVQSADADLGTIVIVQSSSTLGKVQVEAVQVRVEQKGDTTQYNAASYKTNPDATAHDLVSKMPGVTNEGGKVKVNGEEVKKVLVDGKEMFGEDADAALKNMPAEVVDKIQVFDQLSDQSMFTGFDDGQTSKALNIVTKQGKNNGQFGKVYAGYGTDNRYNAGASVNFFKDARRITFVSHTNNINQQNFMQDSEQAPRRYMVKGGRGGSDMGDFSIGPQGGITQTKAIGLNYSDAWGTKAKLSGSYFFNETNNVTETVLSRSYITVSDSGLIYNESSSSSNKTNNHRFNLRFAYDIDSMNAIIITPRLTFTLKDNVSSMLGINVSNEDIAESRTSSNSSAFASSYNFSSNIVYRHWFLKRGRAISIDAGTTFNDKVADETLLSRNEYYSQGDTVILDQESDIDTDGYTLSANLVYTEPAGKTGQLQFTYNPSYTVSDNDKRTFNIDPVAEPQSRMDTMLSNKFSSVYFTNRGGIAYRFTKNKYSLNAGLSVQYATLAGRQEFPLAYDVNRGFPGILPNVSFMYRITPKKNLRLHYRTSTNAPTVSQLQDVIDNSNPLLLHTGNPNLKQNYNHNLMVRFGKTKADKGSGIFFFITGNYTHNYIGNSTIIATSDTLLPGEIYLYKGSQLTMPVNLQGYVNGRSFLTFSRPVPKIRCNLNLHTGLSYSRTPALINNVQNISMNYGVSQGVVLASNISQKIDFTVSYNGSYNFVHNTASTQGNNNYYTQSSSVRLNWIMWKELFINTAANHTLYSGLTDRFNQDYMLWNAALGYKFLEKKNLDIRASVFDILGQNNSISRNVTEIYIEDSRTNILDRYYMLTLTWNIRNYKKAGEKVPAEQKQGELKPAGPSNGN